jgi:hypothetical protein
MPTLIVDGVRRAQLIYTKDGPVWLRITGTKTPEDVYTFRLGEEIVLEEMDGEMEAAADRYQCEDGGLPAVGDRPGGSRTNPDQPP